MTTQTVSKRVIYEVFEELYRDRKGPPLQPPLREAFNEWSKVDKGSLTFDVHCALGTINKMCFRLGVIYFVDSGGREEWYWSPCKGLQKSACQACMERAKRAERARSLIFCC
jgi:hypothetical protein